MRSQFGELDDDGEDVLETRRGEITKAHFDDRQMTIALGPLGISDSTPANPRDPRRLEIREVARVMNDPHQIGFAESNPDFDAALDEIGIEKISHRRWE